MDATLSGTLADVSVLFSVTNRRRRAAPISHAPKVPTADGGAIELSASTLLSVEVFKNQTDWVYEVVATRGYTGSRTVVKRAGYYDSALEAFTDGIARLNELEALRRRPG